MTTPTRSRLDIREVGPRDGLQNERPISTEAELDIIEHLVRAGARRIEATSFVSPRSVPALADAADLAAALQQWPDVRWSALVAGVRGAERAVAAGIFEVAYVVSAADGTASPTSGARPSSRCGSSLRWRTWSGRPAGCSR